MTKRPARRPQTSPASPAFWTLIGRRLRVRRTQIGVDIRQVAKTLGISQSEYKGYESGGVQLPASQLGEIADLFGVPVAWFCQDVGAMAEDVTEAAASAASPGTFRVATAQDRVQALIECFHMLDLEGQQHLLSIAGALSRSNARRARD